MISVILYGRNDSYGYNLHKRAALSLNCIAELLDAPDDEIVFVDYNTPDDFPTFPEAIRDTLTPRARALLRILRVRPAHHRRFAERSHLLALEPVARNVAVRRANPTNRWILSTNTDTIFTPRDGRSLSAIAATLPDGYYHLPRFELPETLWEMLDRADPAATIATIADWGCRYHLNEMVTLPNPAVRYDAPGDFQLILRADLDRMHGFDERVLLGWHVDSNIAARLAMLHGEPRDIVDALFGYHCDHTRQVTPAHRPGAVSNDSVRFVDHVTQPQAPLQADWGLAEERLEDLRLEHLRTTGAPAFLAALDAALPTPRTDPPEIAYGTNFSAGDIEHMAPFVIDTLCTAPPGSAIGWIAADPALLARLRAAWPALGFTTPIRAAVAEPDGTLDPAAIGIIAEADILVFDFSAPPALRAQRDRTMLDDPAIAAAFRRAIVLERDRMTTAPPRSRRTRPTQRPRRPPPWPCIPALSASRPAPASASPSAVAAKPPPSTSTSSTPCAEPRPVRSSTPPRPAFIPNATSSTPTTPIAPKAAPTPPPPTASTAGKNSSPNASTSPMPATTPSPCTSPATTTSSGPRALDAAAAKKPPPPSAARSPKPRTAAPSRSGATGCKPAPSSISTNASTAPPG